MKRVFDRVEKEGSPVHLLIFPEGTYANDKRLNYVTSSQKFSRERNLPILKNVLNPRVKGAHLIFGTDAREHLDCVYDGKFVSSLSLPFLPFPFFLFLSLFVSGSAGRLTSPIS